jgi:hypothetical protein
MSLFPIFKVNIVNGRDNNQPDKIIVFYGNNLDTNITELNNLFKKDPFNKAFENIFDKIELDSQQKNKIHVEFVNYMIYIDDSIGIIKLKIFEALHQMVSMDELYLFCLKQEKLNPITVYQNLTQNDKLTLTKIRLNQILLNIYDTDGELINFGLPDKEKYTFDDIISLDLSNRDYMVANVLGQKFVFSNEYPFIANPYLIKEYDTLLEHSRSEMSSLNNNLLLETGPIFKNTIYVCLAQNVFERDSVSIDYTAKIYYPFLYKDNINTVEKLDSKRNTLINNTVIKLSNRNNKNISLFYDIFRYKKETNKFSENINKKGITFIKITMYPDFKIKIPIDVIFKLLHATKDSPLIKFNPETRQENIYRLYAEQLSTDGRKIPYINKANILKMVRTIGKNKSVAVYTNIVYNGITYNMVCEFYDNGSISVYPFDDHFSSPILLKNDNKNPFEDIDKIIDLTVNPLIQQIKPFFEQSGLELLLFTSIQSTNVEIRDLEYQTVYSITTSININKYIGCVSSIFTVEKDDFKGKNKQAIMRLKRVSNFNKRDSQEAFIIEKIDQGFKFDEIVLGLTENYDNMDEETAMELISKIRNELELTRGANRRRDLMIKINPGFKTTVELNTISSEITVTVSGINDIYYLNTIPIYIDSFVRITQDSKSTDIPASQIKKLCSEKEIEDIEFEDIVAQSEKNIGENSVPIFQNEFIVYPDKKQAYNELEVGENMDDLLDILGFEEEDIIADKGGQPKASKELDLNDLSSLSEASLSESSSEEVPKPTQNVTRPTVESESSLSEASLSESSSEEVPKPNQNVTRPTVESESSLSEASLSESSLSQPSPKELQKPIQPVIDEPSSSVRHITEIEDDIFIDKNKKDKKIMKIGKDMENTVKDITGMKLKYPNPFSSRLENRAPQLFVREKNEKIDVYTRMCPFSLSDRRQPVILTKKEKDEMLAEHPDDINEEADFIEYSTDPNDSSKKFYYTCPRYWCLLTDKMVTEKDILEGKCGPKVDKIEDAIIPNKADEVPKNRYVYQFYDDKDTKYPGFHKKQTPTGLCIPCCYSKWSTTEMKTRRDICQGKQLDDKQPDGKELGQPEKELKRDIQEVENYVKGPEKYGPQLGEHRWGFLPIVVQKFLNEVNEECQISKTNTNLKPNHMCLLRHGVETSSQQSFIACMASAMFYGQFDKTKKPLIQKYIPDAKNDVPSIREMKEIIINAMDVDKFIKYQNGDLVTSFANTELKVDINKPEYKKSMLYKKIQKSSSQIEINRETNESNMDKDVDDIDEYKSNYETQIAFFTKVVQSFENFIVFLRDKTIQIDYTYLWDIICMPNQSLFETGLNLIILEIPDDDITNNIELVCPTNHYSLNTYNARRRSLFLIKRDVYFEPIYGYFTDEATNRLLVTKTFSEYDRQLPKSLKAFFTKIVKPTLGEKCRPLLSRPNEYRFKQPMLLDELIHSLQHKKYTIIEQILNYQGKVIGLLVKNDKDMEGFIPCFPSSLTALKNKKSIEKGEIDFGFSYVSDDIWKPYKETFEFLKEYYDYNDNVTSREAEKTNCSDEGRFCRVVKDEQVIGFLTNTNQFIRVQEPVPVALVENNIKTITSNDAIVADMEILTTLKKDSRRIDYIKRIQLETNFYNAFRNTIRILFNDYSNSEKRKAIQDVCSQRYGLYRQQLNKVIEMLYDLVDDSIIFFTKEKGFDYKVVNENDIHTCISKLKNNCNNDIASVCRIIDNKCTLILPKENLITYSDNEIYYYERMADELIRYNRIKSFIFKPQAYLSFGQIKYNLRNDEIIVLQDLLNVDFFKNLVPAEINHFAKNQTYDTTAPIISQSYNNEFKLDLEEDRGLEAREERACVPSNPEKITSVVWKKNFPTKYSEILYGGNNTCAFYLIIDIIERVKGIQTSIEEVKRVLISEYMRLCDNYRDKNRLENIINILKEETQVDAPQLEEGGLLTFEKMINQKQYYMVNFDLWILLSKYEIPSIIISSKEIPETRYNKNVFTMFTPQNNRDTKYVFILAPALYKRDTIKIPEYKFIMNEAKQIEISLDSLKEEEIVKESIENYYTVEEYIDSVYEKDITTKYKPKRKGIRNIEFVFEDEAQKHGSVPVIPLELDIETKKIPPEPQGKRIVKIKKVKKITPTIFLEEDIEDIEPQQEQKFESPVRLEDILKQREELMPEKVGKTKKQRVKKIEVNPHGKTKKKLPNIAFEVIE